MKTISKVCLGVVVALNAVGAIDNVSDLVHHGLSLQPIVALALDVFFPVGLWALYRWTDGLEAERDAARAEVVKLRAALTEIASDHGIASDVRRMATFDLVDSRDRLPLWQEATQ